MQKLKQCKTVIYVHIKRYDPGWKTFNENAHTKLAHVGFDFSSFQKKTHSSFESTSCVYWLVVLYETGEFLSCANFSLAISD